MLNTKNANQEKRHEGVDGSCREEGEHLVEARDDLGVLDVQRKGQGREHGVQAEDGEKEKEEE